MREPHVADLVVNQEAASVVTFQMLLENVVSCPLVTMDPDVPSPVFAAAHKTERRFRDPDAPSKPVRRPQPSQSRKHQNVATGRLHGFIIEGGCHNVCE